METVVSSSLVKEIYKILRRLPVFEVIEIEGKL